MLFKPDAENTATDGGDGATTTAARPRRRLVSWIVTLLIIGGLGYFGWMALQQRQSATRGMRPDLAVPVLAATPVVKDVPVYLDGVGSVKALNNVTVRAQVDGKLIKVNF